jgi:two-component system phosphate regulon response regulator OmpR
MEQQKPHILIVDDDNRILKLLNKFLNQNGFLTSSATSAEKAQELLKYFIFDLIILDVMLPGATGIDFATSIKSSGGSPPIVMLTALSEPDDRVKGLEAGANDYLSKPFEPKELLIRVRNLIELHSHNKKEQNIRRFGNSYYDLIRKDFYKSGKLVKLSTSEQKLLEILIENSGTAISRQELSEKVGGSLNDRSIDVQIVRIRNKIEDDPKEPKYLKTIRNEGYALYT